jgi:phosphoribosyl 1,2-cyclic phosphodiesterase
MPPDGRLRVKFWGTRGSIPVAMTSAEIRRKLVSALLRAAGRKLETPEQATTFLERELDFAVSHTFGGNSSCVEIITGHRDYVLCDLGSGARVFPSFPVDFSRLPAAIEFVRLEPDRDYDVAGLRVRPKLQRHGGDSYGYRFQANETVVIYSTDAEHKQDDLTEIKAFAEFFRDADLVIFDSQYSLAEATSIKEDWGHSSNVVGLELCQMAHAKRLCLYHHEPVSDDERIAALLAETRRLEEITRGDRRVEILAAYDGMEIAL